MKAPGARKSLRHARYTEVVWWARGMRVGARADGPRPGLRVPCEVRHRRQSRVTPAWLRVFDVLGGWVRAGPAPPGLGYGRTIRYTEWLDACSPPPFATLKQQRSTATAVWAPPN